MSGFGVIIRRDGMITAQEVQQLEADLRYRGPDGVRSVVLDGCVLVHAQLITTDEDAREVQPLRHVSHEWWLVADARLDNREELRRALHGKVRHPLDTDADYLMAAYEHWGEGFASHLVGNFAVALWRQDRSELVIIRDHLGLRPVHWTVFGPTFVAASTLRAVRMHLPADPALDVSHVAEFITHQRTSVTDTFWQRISRLSPAGQLRVMQDLTVTTSRYWDPSPRVDDITVEEAAEGVRSLFEQAVRAHSRARGPIGIQVSGGYDSSTVLSVTRRLAECKGLIALHLVYEQPETDERSHAAAAAAHANVALTMIDSTAVPLVDLSHDAAISGSAFRFFDSHLEDRLITELTARGGRVMLTGQGGDHLLHGGSVAHLDLIRRLRFLAALGQVPADGVQDRVNQLWLGLRRVAIGSLECSRLAAPLGLTSYLARRREPYLQSRLAVLTPEAASSVMIPSSATRIDGAWGYSATQHLRWYMDPFQTYVNEAGDHLGAALSAEYRHPFFDSRLVEFGLGLSPAVVRPRGEYRGLHRRAFDSDLPALVARRTGKADFGRPVAAAILQSVPPVGFESLFRPITDLVRPHAVAVELDHARRYVQGREGQPPNLWQTVGCMQFASWASVWITSSKVVPHS